MTCVKQVRLFKIVYMFFRKKKSIPVSARVLQATNSYYSSSLLLSFLLTLKSETKRRDD
jgi:hypothetical protein